MSASDELSRDPNNHPIGLKNGNTRVSQIVSSSDNSRLPTDGKPGSAAQELSKDLSKWTPENGVADDELFE